PARVDREAAGERDVDVVVAQHGRHVTHRPEQILERGVVGHGIRGYPGMLVPFLGTREPMAKTIRVAAAGDIHAGSAERVGVAGAKGFVGGFGNQWANFGEPLFREAYAETTKDVDGLDRGLAAIEPCALRIALLHYSPVETTLVGEPERLWLVLGADRLAG